MLPKLLGGLSLLLLGPAVGFAQSSPRVYIGASASLVRDNPFRYYNTSRFGPAATVGVQFTPRWGIETGFQFFRQHDSFGSIGLYETSSKTFIVPLLARYTFTDAASRLQVDMLGGGSWLHSIFRYKESYTSTMGETVISSYHFTGNDAALTLGPQVRYKLGSNFEAKLNIPFNLRVNGGGSFSDRLFLTPQLGAQYTFGK